MATKTIERPQERLNDNRSPRIVHLRDWERFERTGEITGLCGTRIQGIPARGQSCVVCRDLGHSAGGRFNSR
jgi:hypothetical protein